MLRASLKGAARDRTGLAAIGLLVLGLAQMAADVTGLRPVKAVLAATGASPAPRVFSAVKGLETFSTRFFVEWTTRDGRLRSVRITPAVYARLHGPYNRRNAYGAALAFGPVLASDPRTRPMLDSVLRFALAADSVLLSELGIDASDRDGPIRVRLEPCEGTDMGDMPTVLEAP